MPEQLLDWNEIWSDVDHEWAVVQEHLVDGGVPISTYRPRRNSIIERIVEARVGKLIGRWDGQKYVCPHCQKPLLVRREDLED